MNQVPHIKKNSKYEDNYENRKTLQCYSSKQILTISRRAGNKEGREKFGSKWKKCEKQ